MEKEMKVLTKLTHFAQVKNSLYLGKLTEVPSLILIKLYKFSFVDMIQ
jgi:hypothetical protein